MDYSGTLYVKEEQGSDYIGVVFAYQSNRKFYVVMWRRENLNYADADQNAGIKGLQLKVTNTHCTAGSVKHDTSILNNFYRTSSASSIGFLFSNTVPGEAICNATHLVQRDPNFKRAVLV